MAIVRTSPGSVDLPPARPSRVKEVSPANAQMLSHAELCERGRRWTGREGRCPIVLVELSTFIAEIPDVLAFRDSGRDSLLIECKKSRSDFLRDRHKKSRQPGRDTLGSYRYYMCEPGVIEVSDLPEKWGLLWVHGRRVEVVAGADPGRYYKPDEDIWRWNIGSREATMMFSALMRIKSAVGAAEFRRLCHTVLNKSFESRQTAGELALTQSLS